MDLFENFNHFKKNINDIIGEIEDIQRTNDIDYDQYLVNLNRVAEQALGLSSEYKIKLKASYLKGKKIHSIFYRVIYKGKMYSTGIKKRVSLGIRDQAGEKWTNNLRIAHEIAMENPPISLDPNLEKLDTWKSSNKHRSRMEFSVDNALVVLSTKKVLKAKGDRDKLLHILTQLKNCGIN